MIETLNKTLDLASANPNAAISLLVAAALLCLAAAPIVALSVVGSVVRALIRRETKEEGQ
jgi:hypothetical protein